MAQKEQHQQQPGVCFGDLKEGLLGALKLYSLCAIAHCPSRQRVLVGCSSVVAVYSSGMPVAVSIH